MARPRGLDVWLYDVHIARLTEPRRLRYRLDFTDDARDQFGIGTRVLSLALPVSTAPTRDTTPAHRPIAAFLEGLLPEGNLRRHLATSAGVAVTDIMALLEHVGGECAGAAQFLPVGEAPTAGTVRSLSEAEVTRLVADLPTYALPAGTTPQASLAGLQDKVLLVAGSDGSWGWPEGGAVSTHLIKPEPTTGAVRHLVRSEHWAMTVAAAAGLPAARTRLQRFDDREAIVVTRYDRTPDGSRTHQEDFCQALGLDPEAKYEQLTSGPSRLRQVARLASERALSPDDFRTGLLRAVTFNLVIGNGDAHSKNYSLLIGRRGEVSLAPLYDVAPVMYLDSRFKGTGHVINGRTSIEQVRVDDLADEGASWGMSRARALKVVAETIEATRDAIDRVPLPARLESIAEQLTRTWTKAEWGPPPSV